MKSGGNSAFSSQDRKSFSCDSISWLTEPTTVCSVSRSDSDRLGKGRITSSSI
jgi:hypothetical protein